MSRTDGKPAPDPFRPGAFTRLMARIDSLPGGGWWVYAGLLVGLNAWGHGVLWAAGRVPTGVIDLSVVTPSVYGPLALVGLALGNRVAQQALVTFWPATGWPEQERARWAFEFRHTPAAYTLPAVALGLALTIGALIGLPDAVLGAREGRFWVYVAQAPSHVFGYGLAILVGVHVLRWLRLVARIHREATAIDPFDRAPVFAFSRLTGSVGLLYVVVAYYSVTVNAAFQAGNVVSLVIVATITVLGTVAFIAPLWGIHGKLVRLKASLVRDCEARIDTVAAELYRRVEARDFGSTKEVIGTLDGMTTLRNRIAQLPTWPWPPQLLRGFLSALLLPIVLFVLTRFIGAQLGG